jgi:hypothetical protein
VWSSELHPGLSAGDARRTSKVEDTEARVMLDVDGLGAAA